MTAGASLNAPAIHLVKHQRLRIASPMPADGTLLIMAAAFSAASDHFLTSPSTVCALIRDRVHALFLACRLACFFPLFSMRTWIEELFNYDVTASAFQPGSDLTKKTVDVPGFPPAAAVMSNDRFRVRVYHGGPGRGDSLPHQFWLICDFYMENGWRPILQLHEMHLYKVLEVLKDVQKFLGW